MKTQPTTARATELDFDHIIETALDLDQIIETAETLKLAVAGDLRRGRITITFPRGTVAAKRRLLVDALHTTGRYHVVEIETGIYSVSVLPII